MNKLHRKLSMEDHCICGSDMIFIYGRFHCVERLQKELAYTDYKLIRKEN